MKKYLLFFLISLLFPNLSFANITGKQKDFENSYQRFNQIIDKDPELKKITHDISLFLEAKKKSYSKKNSSTLWKNLFKGNESHMTDEFAESWTIIQLDKALEIPSILKQAKSYNILPETREILQIEENEDEEINSTKDLSYLLSKFILNKGLKNHISTKPARDLKLHNLKEKVNNSLLHKVLLLVSYDLLKDQDQVISLSKKIIPKLLKDKKFRYLAFEIYRIRIKTLRHTGKRLQAALEYRKLTGLWDTIKSYEFPKEINFVKQELDKANDYLWSSRYEALIGEEERAKKTVNTALYFLAKLNQKKLRWGKQLELRELLFEAYYIKTFRIAMYFGKYEDGTKWAKEILTEEKKTLSVKWKDNFNWVLGLSYFLRSDFTNAYSTWKDFLKTARGRSSHGKRLFWLAEVSQKIGKKDESIKHQEELKKINPFSFYTRNLIHIPTIPSLKKLRTFEKSKKQKGKINTSNKLLISVIRSEILLESGLNELAKAELKQAYRLTRPRKFTESNLSFYLYFASLLKEAQLYRTTISLVDILSRSYKNFWSKNSESLSLFYPEAFKENFEKASNRTNLELPLLYSIARRESVFNPLATSFANAKGLMQMTPKTAQNISIELGLQEKKIDLYDIDKSLYFSSLYLSKLKKLYKDKPYALIASYNAGEYCVDKWLETIKEKDPKIFIELIPFSETRNYTKNILGTMSLYKKIIKSKKSKRAKLLKYTKKYYSL